MHVDQSEKIHRFMQNSRFALILPRLVGGNPDKGGSAISARTSVPHVKGYALYTQISYLCLCHLSSREIVVTVTSWTGKPELNIQIIFSLSCTALLIDTSLITILVV